MDLVLFNIQFSSSDLFELKTWVDLQASHCTEAPLSFESLCFSNGWGSLKLKTPWGHPFSSSPIAMLLGTWITIGVGFMATGALQRLHNLIHWKGETQSEMFYNLKLLCLKIGFRVWHEWYSIKLLGSNWEWIGLHPIGSLFYLDSRASSPTMDAFMETPWNSSQFVAAMTGDLGKKKNSI